MTLFIRKNHLLMTLSAILLATSSAQAISPDEHIRQIQSRCSQLRDPSEAQGCFRGDITTLEQIRRREREENRRAKPQQTTRISNPATSFEESPAPVAAAPVAPVKPKKAKISQSSKAVPAAKVATPAVAPVAAPAAAVVAAPAAAPLTAFGSSETKAEPVVTTSEPAAPASTRDERIGEFLKNATDKGESKNVIIGDGLRINAEGKLEKTEASTEATSTASAPATSTTAPAASAAPTQTPASKSEPIDPAFRDELVKKGFLEATPSSTKEFSPENTVSTKDVMNRIHDNKKSSDSKASTAAIDSKVDTKAEKASKTEEGKTCHSGGDGQGYHCHDTVAELEKPKRDEKAEKAAQKAADAKAPAADSCAAWKSPMRGSHRVTDCLGGARPGGRRHAGLDFGNGQQANTPIFSVGAGKVIQAGWMGGYGCVIQVLHDECPGPIQAYPKLAAGKCVSFYAHLQPKGKTCPMSGQTGEKVTSCTKLAIMGGSGGNYPKHLHFEMRLQKQSGVRLNPLVALGKEIKGAANNPGACSSTSDWLAATGMGQRTHTVSRGTKNADGTK